MSCQQLGSYSSSLTPFRLIFNRLSSVSRLSDELIIRSKELQLYYQYSKHHTRLNVSREMLLSSESHGAKVGNLLCKQTSPKWSYIRFCFSPISPAAVAAAASAGMRQRDSCHRLIPLLTFRLRDFPSCKFFLQPIIGETKNSLFRCLICGASRFLWFSGCFQILRRHRGLHSTEEAIALPTQLSRVPFSGPLNQWTAKISERQMRSKPLRMKGN